MLICTRVIPNFAPFGSTRLCFRDRYLSQISKSVVSLKICGSAYLTPGQFFHFKRYIKVYIYTSVIPNFAPFCSTSSVSEIVDCGLDTGTLTPPGDFRRPIFLCPLGCLKKYWPGLPSQIEPKSRRFSGYVRVPYAKKDIFKKCLIFNMNIIHFTSGRLI